MRVWVRVYINMCACVCVQEAMSDGCLLPSSALSLKQRLSRNNFAAALDPGRAIAGLHGRLAGQERGLQGPGAVAVGIS